MRNSSQHKSSQPSDPFGACYWGAITRYLGWLGVACLIAGFRAGPVMLLVWLAAAYALTREPEPPSQKPLSRSCNRSKRRRC